MAEDIGVLVARVVADTEQFRSEMLKMTSQISSNTARMNKALGSVNTGLNSLRGGFALAAKAAAAFGIALSARAVVSFAASTITASAELYNLSKRLGISVEALSELQYIAKITDVDFQTFTQSLQIMERTIGQTVTQGGEAADAFNQLGINLKVLRSLAPDQQFAVIAEALSRVGDESVRAALAQQMFGRGGIVMLQAIEGGAGAINKLREEARSLGITLSTEAAEQADAAKDAMDRLSAATTSLVRDAVQFAVPWIEKLADAFRRLVRETPEERALLNPISDAKQRIQELQDEIKSGEPTLLERLFGDSRSVAQLNIELEAAFRRLELLEGQRARAANAPKTGGGGTNPLLPPGALGNQKIGGTGDKAKYNALQPIDVAAQKANEDTLFGFTNLQKEMTKIAVEEDKARTASWIDAWTESLDASYKAAEIEKSIRANVADAAIGFLQAVGSEHRGAAIAALALQKVMTLKQIFFSGQAQARAEAAWAAVFGGPGAAAAAYARVMLMTKIQMGLVAATGLIEAAQLSHGGTQSTRGTTANPIVTTGSGGSSAAVAGTATAASRSQRVLELHVHGNVYGAGGVQELVNDIRDVIDNADVIVFGPNSRQALVRP